VQAGHVTGQVGGQHQPAETEGGSEALAGRAGVDDVLGRQRLDGAEPAEIPVRLDLERYAAGYTRAWIPGSYQP
jgi:hypothetical protein